MSQIALPFDWPAAESDRDFIVTPANSAAIRHMDHWSLWPLAVTILTGPRKSGRSFLGRIFAARSGAQLIDGAERVDEERLFHAWNRAQADHKPLLLIADAPVPIWEVTLPDLRSRLAATPHVAISNPDDALIVALIERLMAARGLALGRDVASWISRRIERSYIAVNRVVDALDEAAWSKRSRISVTVARDALVRAGVIEDSSDLV